MAPDLVGISLATTVEFKTGTSVEEKNLALEGGRSSSRKLHQQSGGGETLVVNEIADRIRNADPKILDLGEVNREISEIFVWRLRSDSTRFSRFLVANLTPGLGERIVVECVPIRTRPSGKP